MGLLGEGFGFWGLGFGTSLQGSRSLRVGFKNLGAGYTVHRVYKLFRILGFEDSEVQGLGIKLKLRDLVFQVLIRGFRV